MEPWDADLSPYNFATTHYPAERSSLSPCNFSIAHLTACILKFATHEIRGCHGGVEKRGGQENPTNDTPPRKGFWTPPRTVRFPPPSGVSALFFLYKNPWQSRPEALLEGSRNFREDAFSGTFSSSTRFAPPISRPKWNGGPFCNDPKRVVL